MISVSGLLMLAPAMLGHVSALSVIGPTMLLLAGMGVMMPSAMAGALQGFPRMAGAASALLGFLQMGFAGLGSAAVGALQGLTPIAMPIVFAVSAGLCLVVFLAARPGRR
jgi:DHA1 family bicyclomycin/chloramphenicol resistance-like MFS transporter